MNGVTFSLIMDDKASYKVNMPKRGIIKKIPKNMGE